LEATRDRRLMLPWCTGCERPHWYPREVCPWCLGDAIAWRAASGRATVHAVSVHHRAGMPQMEGREPYAVALVDLAEGVRMMTNVVGCDPADVAVGQAVVVTWESLSDGRNLPLFRPGG
jgi:uncharacterized OB-fold protein